MKIRISKFDTLFSKIVRLRDRFNCQKCRRYYPQGHGLQCAHVFSRRHQSTRYDFDNAVALCFADHQYFGENPTIFTAWIKKHLGEVRYAELEARHSKIVKRTKADSEALYEHLKGEYRALQDEPDHVVTNYD
jgi:hypothetical protein